jgi:hypothetical protein
MGSSQRRVLIIVGLSIAVHAAVAVWAMLFGDPFTERYASATPMRRVFLPDDDEVIADVTFDVRPPRPAPAPVRTVVPAPAPAPVHAPAHAHAPTRTHDAPMRLAETPPTPESLVNGLFSDERAPLAKRTPGSDIAREADAARRHDHAAQIGDSDPRTRGDDRPRTGTGPDCTCDPDIVPRNPAPPPPPEVPPPPIHVDPPRTAVPTTLSPDEVLDLVTTKYMAGLQRCQTQLLRRDGEAGGRVGLALTIDGDGAVTAASADGVDAQLDRCVETRAAGWRFPIPHDPTSGDPTTAHFSLSLSLQQR